MAKPTYRDATLLLQFAQWGAASGVPEASNWVWSDEFVSDYAEFKQQHPFGSPGSYKVQQVCGYFETLGTLWKHGLLNAELIFDWMAVAMIWDRVKGIPLGLRQDSGNPRLYENFEALAGADVAHNARPIRRAARPRRSRK